MEAQKVKAKDAVPDSRRSAVRRRTNLAFVPGHEGLRRLALALRGEMPEGFRWDYTIALDQCGTSGCAIGLAHVMWPKENILGRASGNILNDLFEMDWESYEKIFLGRSRPDVYGVSELSQITPIMVADKIDQYLEAGSV